MPLTRIGILAPPWPIPPKAYGGVEIALDGLCRGLSDAGIEVYLWSHPDSTCPVHRGSVAIPDRLEAGWHGAPTEVRHVLEGYDWFAGLDVDLIHDHTFVGPLIGRTLTSKPLTTTNWLPFYPPAAGETFPDLSRIYRAIAQQVPVIALSQGQADRAREIVSRVIHLGTDIVGVQAGPGTGDEHGEYLAFVGRMAMEKGVGRAISLAREAGIRLRIAARMDEDEEIEYYRTEVEPHLDGHWIEYVGELGPAAKTELLRGASAMLNPITWEEPFGLVMIEALAAGTPVIASRGGSVAEIVAAGLTGAVCDSDEELLAAILARGTFSRSACRERAERLFSNATMTAQHIDFYTELIQKAG